MAKKIFAAEAAVWALCAFLSGCSSGSSGVFGDPSKLSNAESRGLNALYNEDYKYFCMGIDKFYCRLDDKGNLNVNCRDASCLHDSLECDAYAGYGGYFVWHEKLYREYETFVEKDGVLIPYGHIVDTSDGTEVFSNPVPDGMDPEKKIDDSTTIADIVILNKDYLKVDGQLHTYLLDKDFQVKYWYDDECSNSWGMIDGKHYYYVNDILQLIRVDLETGSVQTIDTGCRIVSCDNDDENIYYSDGFGDLYRCSLADGSCTKIAENAYFFSVCDPYIYCRQDDAKQIIDKTGRRIADYTDCVHMDPNSLVQIGDKMYAPFWDEIKAGVAEMDLDGKNYKEYNMQ